MAAGGGQQQDQAGDSAYTPLYIVLAVCIVGFVAWYQFRGQIVMVMMHLKVYQIYLLRFFDPSLEALQTSLLSQIASKSYLGMQYDGLVHMLEQVGKIWRYPVAVILGLLALKLFFGSPIVKYKRTLSMQTLTEQEASDWPQITPVVKLDLVKEHAEKGQWAMGQTPMQFAKKHRLLLEAKEVVDSDVLRAQEQMIVSLLRGAAYQVFATQLGAYWNGIERLPIYKQALFAVFASRIGGDRAGAANLLSQIAASAKFDPKKKALPQLNYAGTAELLKKHQNNKLIAKITQQHAFVTTVMASMLMTARNDGVVASADFLWLKVVDRPLWFLLNSVGRRTVFAEAAGPFGHWIAELQLGQAIRLPMVEEAINGLDAALKEVIYVPDEIHE
jgi:intracellular multiplication protein IcmP